MTTENGHGHGHSDLDETKQEENNIKHVIAIGSVIKTFGGWIFGIASIVISVVFWIQTQGADTYYPKLAGENLEKQLTRLEQKLENLESGNREVIRLLGRLEAQTERDQ